MTINNRCGTRFANRQGASSAGDFRRVWRIQRHLCRGKLGADAARLAGKPYPDGQFLWWLQRDHGLRQSQSGREQSLPLRPATESKLSAVGGALWRCSTAGPSSPSIRIRPRRKCRYKSSSAGSWRVFGTAGSAHWRN